MHHSRSLALVALFLFLAGCGDQFSSADTGGGLAGVAETPGGLPENTGAVNDDDGLDNAIESAGWDIVVDTHGFGISTTRSNLETRTVTSDPTLDDTDGDGLTDLEEYLLRTDPRAKDTDRDGLSDYDEWYQWLTSPVSVDSDGDAVGPDGIGAPNASLFDLAETLGTTKGKTSPTLADTDGDGATDAEEIDHAFRSPLIADLPRVQLELVGAPDVRLFVEYEDSVGTTEEYSSVLTTSKETATTSSHSSTHEQHRSVSATATVSFAGNAHGVAGGFSVAATRTWGSTDAVSRSIDRTSVQSTQREAGRYWGDSSTRTETAARGEVRMQMRIHNVSNSISYRLTQLGIAARFWTYPDDPSEEATFQTLAVLTPEGFDNFTLAPGGSTDVLPVLARDVNPDIIKQFLTHPQRLTFEPVYYDLENAEGLNFRFLTENAFSRTAMIGIDLGTGAPDEFRVATNVARSAPDSDHLGGALYEGLLLSEALRDVLGIEYTTTDRSVTYKGVTKTVEVLDSVEGYAVIQSPVTATRHASVKLTEDSREIKITELGTTSADKAAVGELDAGWESAVIGRTLVVSFTPGDSSTEEKLAFVIVDVTDPGTGAAIIDLKWKRSTRTTTNAVVNDLYQVHPHADAEDPSRPATVTGSPRQAYWMVFGTNEAEVDPHMDFSDIRVHAGDQLRLSYWIDNDGDGVSSRTEQVTGTEDEEHDDCPNSVDCDEDGLMDSVESIRGWIAGAPSVLPVERKAFFAMLEEYRADPTAARDSGSFEDREFHRLKAKLVLDDPLRGYPRWVHPSPTSRDTDGDGLADLFECIHGSDPTRADTDGDGIEDGVDAFPLEGARVLRVNGADGSLATLVSPGINDDARGLTWETAFEHLQDALEAARDRNSDYLPRDNEDDDLVLDGSNDISAIWVTGGVYTPASWASGGPAEGEYGANGKTEKRSFELVPGVVVVGGFTGTETSLADRSDDAARTILSGANVGVGNARHVVNCGSEDSLDGAQVGREAGLENLTIRAGGVDDVTHGGGFRNYGGSPTIRRVIFDSNTAENGAAVAELSATDGDETIEPAGRYELCTFTSNLALARGGAVSLQNSSARFVDCLFQNNAAPRPLSHRPPWRATGHDGDGGAISILGAPGSGHVLIEGCEFTGQLAARGGAIAISDGKAMIRSCRFGSNGTSPTRLDAFDFPFRNWVRGLTATVSGKRVDRLRQSPDLSKAERKKKNTYRDIENLGSASVAKEGDKITFGPGSGAVSGLGSFEDSGSKPQWSPPQGYLDRAETVIRDEGDEGKSAGAGGAIFANGTTRLAVVQCSFFENDAAVGGGIAFFTSKSVNILSCTFARNRSLAYGSAVFAHDWGQDGRMVNCILAGQDKSSSLWKLPAEPNFKINLVNGSNTKGGDPYKLFGLFPYLDNVNSGKYYGGDVERSSGGYYRDGWRNLTSFKYRSEAVPGQLYIREGSFEVENCLLRNGPQGGRGGSFAGGKRGNVLGGNANGSEVALEDVGDYEGLVPLSECAGVDAGKVVVDYDPFKSGTQGPPSVDLAGAARQSGRSIDIGAYEYQSD